MDIKGEHGLVQYDVRDENNTRQYVLLQLITNIRVRLDKITTVTAESNH